MSNTQMRRPKKKKTKYEKLWLNAEGYHDLTAYLALRSIEKVDTRRHYS